MVGIARDFVGVSGVVAVHDVVKFNLSTAWSCVRCSGAVQRTSEGTGKNDAAHFLTGRKGNQGPRRVGFDGDLFVSGCVCPGLRAVARELVSGIRAHCQ